MPLSCKALVQAGADVDATTSVGTTALMLSAAAGNTDAMAALLDAGADVNAKEAERGHTALMFAAAANRLPAVTLLLARRADPSVATRVTDLAALSRSGENPDGRNLPTNTQGVPVERAARIRQRDGSRSGAGRGAARPHARGRSLVFHQRARRTRTAA